MGGVHRSHTVHKNVVFSQQESANSRVDRTDDGEVLTRRFRTIQEMGDRTHRVTTPSKQEPSGTPRDENATEFAS